MSEPERCHGTCKHWCPDDGRLRAGMCHWESSQMPPWAYPDHWDTQRYVFYSDGANCPVWEAK